MKQTLISVLILFALVGCKTIEKTVEVEKEVKVVERDTTIVIQEDSAMVQALFECDSLNNVVLKELSQKDGERIQTQIKYVPTNKGGVQLQVDCKEDSLQRIIQWQDSIISIKTTTTQTEYIRRRSAYDKFVSWGFWILVGAIVTRIGVKLYFKI